MNVKEESEKAVLKLNIKKYNNNKVMASDLITSWQIEAKKLEVVTDFIFLTSKITAYGDCSCEIKNKNKQTNKQKMLAPERKAVTNLDRVLKSSKIIFLTNFCITQAMVLWGIMYECKSYTIKKDECWRIYAFELWCCRRLLRMSWTTRELKQSILKQFNPEYSLKGLLLKMKLQYLGHLMWRADSLEKTLMLGKI